ncbi:hypothetical protein ADK75_10100 [Streptomyces virginiae]|uniref:ATP-grasp domain-containing protein n=2 Tax=Streptomyces TaxID=1883 RepID=A0A0L8MZB1_STRVG|nr:hypothetical protein ADK75_10100 [Streptomyces virginiae]
MIYQEIIPGGRHLRMNVLGERTVTVLLESEDLDWRPNLDIPAREVLIPNEIEESVLATLKSLGLNMGAVDMKITDDGKYVFLEVNPQGQFLFLEGMCGVPITDRVADYFMSEITGNLIPWEASPNVRSL